MKASEMQLARCNDLDMSFFEMLMIDGNTNTLTLKGATGVPSSMLIHILYMYIHVCYSLRFYVARFEFPVLVRSRWLLARVHLTY